MTLGGVHTHTHTFQNDSDFKKPGARLPQDQYVPDLKIPVLDSWQRKRSLFLAFWSMSSQKDLVCGTKNLKLHCWCNNGRGLEMHWFRALRRQINTPPITLSSEMWIHSGFHDTTDSGYIYNWHLKTKHQWMTDVHVLWFANFIIAIITTWREIL